jgi:hypothetical protein
MIILQKQQFFVEFVSPLTIPKENLNVVKYSTEYLATLNEGAFEIFSASLKTLQEVLPVPFDNTGLTKADCLNMCKQHDINVQNKNKHPLTPDQIKLNEDNKQKQKEGKTNKEIKPNLKNDEHKDEWPPSMSLPLDIYIEFYIKQKVYEDKIYESKTAYMTSIFHKQYPKEIKYDEKGFLYEDRTLKIIKEYLLKDNLQQYLSLKVLLEHYNKQSNLNYALKLLKVIIFSLYFICWMYILVASVHTLNIFELLAMLNLSWLDLLDPFSNMRTITNNDNIYFQTIIKEIISTNDKTF